MAEGSILPTKTFPILFPREPVISGFIHSNTPTVFWWGLGIGLSGTATIWLEELLYRTPSSHAGTSFIHSFSTPLEDLIRATSYFQHWGYKARGDLALPSASKSNDVTFTVSWELTKGPRVLKADWVSSKSHQRFICLGDTQVWVPQLQGGTLSNLWFMEVQSLTKRPRPYNNSYEFLAFHWGVS